MDLLEQWEEATRYKVSLGNNSPKGCIVYIGKNGSCCMSKKFKIDGKWKSVSLHRMAHMLFVGKIPHGKIVFQTCHNKKCINPDHLKIKTRKEFAQEVLKREGYRPNAWKTRSKLSVSQTVDIRCSKLNSCKLAKLYNISVTQITRIRNGSRCSGVK